MNKELAKTLTLALVNYLDDNRPEGTMDCSSAECERLEKAFEVNNLDFVEGFMEKKLSRLTEFEVSLRQIIEETLSDEVPNGSGGTMSWAVALSGDDIKKLAPKVLALAKKELIKDDELAKKHLDGYCMGREDTLKEMMDFVESHFHGKKTKEFDTPMINIPAWEPPCYRGGPCTNPMRDCINCPGKTTGGGFNTTSGTSTSKAEG